MVGALTMGCDFIIGFVSRVCMPLLALVLMVGADAAADTLDIDAPVGRQISAEYFGQHLHHLVRRGLPQDPPEATPWPEGQVGALRLWDSSVRWAEIQPSRNQWRFSRLDAYVGAAQERAVPVIFTLGSTPRWASARPDEPCSYGYGCAAEPADLDDWDQYVATLARRYKGQIQWYELWNEPHPDQSFKNSGFFNGGAETLVVLARRARAVLQREDPAARLLTPGFVNREKELERFLVLGGAAEVQGVAYHFYSSGDQQLIQRFVRVQASRRRHGLADKPLFNTESGFEVVPASHAGPGNPERSPSQAAAMNARAWILGTMLGLDGWFHHGWDREATAMVDRAGQMTPTGIAWRAVRQWLIGATPIQCRLIGPNLLRCRFETARGPLWVLWQPNAEARPSSVELSQEGRQPVRVERLLGSEPHSSDLAGHEGSFLLRVSGEPVAVWSDSAPSAASAP